MVEQTLQQLRTLAESVLVRAKQDATLLIELRDNPAAVLERESGARISQQIQVLFHTGLDGKTFLDVQSVDTLASAELTDDELAFAAGGVVSPTINVSFNNPTGMD
ncbi:MAG TPA: hypothetical protein PKM88_05340 [bacterium]|nr:hypothetical protein [bacterium]